MRRPLIPTRPATALLRLVLLSGAILSLAAGAPASAWTYTNERFGYSVEIPDSFGKAIVESSNSDGMVLNVPNYRATLRVYAANHDPALSSTDFVAHLSGHPDFETVGYKVIRDDWLVLSGTRDTGETVYYLRVAFSDDRSRISVLEFANHRLDARHFDDEVRLLSHSLTAPASTD